MPEHRACRDLFALLRSQFANSRTVPCARSSSIQAGAWSRGPRISTFTPALRSRSEMDGLTSRWSIRRPELRS